MVTHLIQTESILVSAFFTILQLILQIWREGGKTFFLTLIAGCVLSVLTWFFTHWVAVNVNNRFSSRIQLYIACFATSFVTFICVILFVSLQYVEPVARIAITAWEASIQNDQQWNDETFIQAYDEVYALKSGNGQQLENFSGYPHPDNGGRRIPTNFDATKQVVAMAFIDGATKHFNTNLPFLSWILWADSGNAQADILADMTRVFAGSGGTYDLSKATKIAGEKILQELVKQTKRVVIFARLFLFLCFVLLQGLVFALLVYLALKDIKVNFSTQN